MAPYIGITGFMTQAEVRAVLEVVPPDASRKLMVGVLASSKTLAVNTNKYPGRYPHVLDINGIMVDDPRTINLIHYATDDQPTLADQLFKLWYTGGYLLNGFQLNMAWPDPEQLEQAKERGAEFVLQVGGHALQFMNRDPTKLACKLDDYAGLVDSILIDPSGGKGQPFDPVLASKLLSAIRERHPKLGLGVAGGLSAQTLHLVEPLIRLFPNLSIDAEGKLRNPSDDSLNIVAARQYVAKAYTLFS